MSDTTDGVPPPEADAPPPAGGGEGGPVVPPPDVDDHGADPGPATDDDPLAAGPAVDEGDTAKETEDAAGSGGGSSNVEPAAEMEEEADQPHRGTNGPTDDTAEEDAKASSAGNMVTGVLLEELERQFVAVRTERDDAHRQVTMLQSELANAQSHLTQLQLERSRRETSDLNQRQQERRIEELQGEVQLQQERVARMQLEGDRLREEIRYVNYGSLVLRIMMCAERSFIWCTTGRWSTFTMLRVLSRPLHPHCFLTLLHFRGFAAI